MPINAQILDNPKSDRVRRIADLTRAKGRERSGRFLIEGPQSVREAVTWRPDVVQDLYVEVSQALEHPRIIFSTLEKIVETSQDATIYVHYCTGDVMRRISPDAQGIAAVGNAESMHAGADDVELGKNGRAPQIAAFWQVRDPGNAGTVIRSADAAGCAGVVLVDDCVDIFNPKVIRSTAGSLFHLPVVSMGTDEYFDWCAERGLAVYAADVYGTDARPPEPLTDVLAVPQSLAQAKTVLFGNEARGLTQDVLERVDRIVSIPIYGKAESLNLGTSAAVMLLSLAMSSHVERM